MAQSARQPEQRRRAGAVQRRPQRRRTGWERAAAFVFRNPKALGGGTALLVALSFVSANALWYQPHAHAGAFFATRAPSGGLTVGSTQAEVPARAAPLPDPTLRRVQAALSDMAVYAGPVDGLDGPNTRKAILSFQAAGGLPATGEVDAALIAALMEHSTSTASVPATRPTAEADERGRTMKIQAALKAFGNDGIEIDGIMGARTEAAIREFQGLFGLPESGRPDQQLYDKMREVGLAD